MSNHIRNRLAVHEAAHAAANLILGMTIHSVQIRETDGVVKVEPGADTFDRCVALLAAGIYDMMSGQEPSGDTFDQDEVSRILGRQVAPSAIPEALAVLEEAAVELAGSVRFRQITRTIAQRLLREGTLAGSEVEDIFDAIERDRRLTATRRHSIETHDGRRRPSVQWRDHPVGTNHLAACVLCVANPDRAREAKTSWARRV
jgi:hypothetical protein